MYLVYSTSTLYRITETDSNVLQRKAPKIQSVCMCVYVYIYSANRCNVY